MRWFGCRVARGALIDRLSLYPLTGFDLGAFCAALIALVAWRTRLLSGSGAIAAFFVGATVFGFGGWPKAAVLFAFFVPSVLLSLVGRKKKRALREIGKTGARDGAQVLANGAIAAICAAFASGGDSVWSAAFAGAFAAATADTWATEIGTLSPRNPRSILNGKPLQRGLSGGVSLLGTAAQIAGALFIAVIARVSGASGAFVAIAVAGIVGATVDSLLGATLQALRYCAHCNMNCEEERHTCGADTSLLRGVAWMNNDAVNFAATACGAAVAAVLLR